MEFYERNILENNDLVDSGPGWPITMCVIGVIPSVYFSVFRGGEPPSKLERVPRVWHLLRCFWRM
ncbi:hypothetical protein HYDPIDRAFT_113111 [Hydnomerulius pinastri MD-312]|uniref:Uncharacterized protein n=1 Tax=Hydnomerulius pinastri MD-312 TaxID=994086 RepID=A0A0C9WES7_9AGAM|nr:hypothetical protein HYDPIDRAFT_113111 [Hydnomerulius pinastri MD-312]